LKFSAKVIQAKHANREKDKESLAAAMYMV